ncbi:DoxX family protein [Nocardia sp. CA-119907]|uniref:DoxX family protein n=1 Tax=Nocardia sp. CA-119907 TaxID=3239973 RepID=UPI003D972E78
MSLLRPIARVLTGSTYAVLGWEAAREPGARVKTAAGTLAAVRKVVPLPADDELIVRANGAAQAVGGALLALGVLPRLSAVTLAASLVPTTLAGHAFWKEQDPVARKTQRIQFQKNVAMLGGLTFALLGAEHGS